MVPTQLIAGDVSKHHMTLTSQQIPKTHYTFMMLRLVERVVVDGSHEVDGVGFRKSPPTLTIGETAVSHFVCD